MKIFKSFNVLNKEINFNENIGFVPTMGSLHDGHLSLIKIAKKKSKKVLVSIFINPSQFNDKKDFNKYPRNLNKDISKLKKLKIDYLFLPNNQEIYKKGIKKKLMISKNDRILCAKHRIGHFEGVLAVINQLLSTIKAEHLFLGNKDYQQIYLIKKFIKNKFKTKVISCNTIRNNNSLAYSSRNLLLSKNDLYKAAMAINKVKLFYSQIKKNIENSKNINILKKQISSFDIKVQYLEIRNKFNLSKKYNKKNLKIFIAFYINKVRLIDNF